MSEFYNEEVYSTRSYAISRSKAKKLYFLFIKYKDLEFNQFFSSIKEEFKGYIDVEEIKYLIRFTKKHLSPERSVEMHSMWCSKVNELKKVKKYVKKENN